MRPTPWVPAPPRPSGCAASRADRSWITTVNRVAPRYPPHQSEPSHPNVRILESAWGGARLCFHGIKAGIRVWGCDCASVPGRGRRGSRDRSAHLGPSRRAAPRPRPDSSPARDSGQEAGQGHVARADHRPADRGAARCPRDRSAPVPQDGQTHPHPAQAHPGRLPGGHPPGLRASRLSDRTALETAGAGEARKDREGRRCLRVDGHLDDNHSSGHHRARPGRRPDSNRPQPGQHQPVVDQPAPTRTWPR